MCKSYLTSLNITTNVKNMHLHRDSNPGVFCILNFNHTDLQNELLNNNLNKVFFAINLSLK